MIVVTQLPFLVSIYYSFTNLKDRTQSLIPEPTKFVGIDNYKAIFNDPFFRQAMWTSVKMTVLAVGLSLFFGTLFAVLLDRKFHGQGLVPLPDHAVPSHAGGGGADLEAADVLVALRDSDRCSRSSVSARWPSSRIIRSRRS